MFEKINSIISSIKNIRYSSKYKDFFSSDYQNICEMFMELDLSIEQKKIISQILYKGKYKEYDIRISDDHRFEIQYGALKRLSLAYLFLINPETFMEIINSDIKFFHGTNSNALPSILANGLISHERANTLEIDVTTGEEFSRKQYKPRNFVSFSDILDVAETYSLIGVEETDKLLSFPVIFGVKQNKDKFDYLYYGDVREFAVADNVPIKEIDIILVPSQKIEIVKKMIADLNIKVFPLDDIQKKFYQMIISAGEEGPSFAEIVYDKERFGRIIESSQSATVFDIEDVKSFVLLELGKDVHAKRKKN